jgi:hypothetical protein
MILHAKRGGVHDDTKIYELEQRQVAGVSDSQAIEEEDWGSRWAYKKRCSVRRCPTSAWARRRLRVGECIKLSSIIRWNGEHAYLGVLSSVANLFSVLAEWPPPSLVGIRALWWTLPCSTEPILKWWCCPQAYSDDFYS